MSRPVRLSADRWLSKRHAQGYVKPTSKGVAWMHFSQSKRTTGLRWIPENKRACIAMLDAWIDDLKADPRERRMWSDVFAEYDAAYIEKQPTPVQRAIKYAFDAYFPPKSAAVDRLHFRYADLRDYLTTRHAELSRTLSRGTVKAYRSAVSRLFRTHAIPRDYIDRDPTQALERNVGSPGKVDVLIWTAAEVELIARHASEPLGLWYRWQYLTGMRPSESARMRWDDFTDGGLTIYGAAKGARKAGDIERDGVKLRPRAFVLREPRESDSDAVARWMADMMGIVERMRDLTGSTPFVWTDEVRLPELTEPVRVSARTRAFRRAAKLAGVALNQRRLYDLRASAGDAMDAAGLDDRLISDLSGHDVNMRMTRYRPARDVERLDRRMPGK